LKRHRQVTPDDVYKSIKTDVINAGGKWEDSQVVTSNGVVTRAIPAISTP
jgi:protease I